MLPECAPLLETVLDRCSNHESHFHGPDHWRRVAWIGLRLCREVPEADPMVALLFGVFHDSMRVHDGDDPEHGRRASGLIRELHGEAFVLNTRRLETLCHACDLHADGLLSDDPTTAVCWDADRLDLWRVFVTPDRRFMTTSAARREGMAEWSRGLQGQTPDWGTVWEGYEALLASRSE